MLEVNIKHIDIVNKIPIKRILSNVYFNLDKGNVYTILGKNGSGKSTLINCLTRLLDINIYSVDANVVFNGADIYEINNNELIELRRNKIRYVFQDAINSFDHLKTFGYYFKDIMSNETDSLLEYFLLPPKEKLFDLYPYEVSGGMAQRISLCLAILTKSELLILDEPTSAIDITISNLICKKLRGFVKELNSSILIITQDFDFADEVSDFVAYMDKGRLSEFSKNFEFKEKLT